MSKLELSKSTPRSAAVPFNANKRRPKNKELLLDRDACISCAGCIGMCPDLALDMFGTDLQVFQEECTYCTICVRICPVGALSIEKK
jgi:Na+-translocating ferredoxin:NAD+ oxidoreductase RNF subunit RnfB